MLNLLQYGEGVGNGFCRVVCSRRAKLPLSLSEKLPLLSFIEVRPIGLRQPNAVAAAGYANRPHAGIQAFRYI